MTKNQTFGLLMLGALAISLSCDGASAGTSAGLGAGDCPFGTFRPAGIDQCVFPASDINNQLIGVSDNRCAFGQPAIPPSCVSDIGERAYLSTSSTCAPGYRFLDGACNRGAGGFGGGFFPTGGAGVGFGGFGGGESAGANGGCVFGVNPETGQCLPSVQGSGGMPAAPDAGGAGGTGGTD